MVCVLFLDFVAFTELGLCGLHQIKSIKITVDSCSNEIDTIAYLVDIHFSNQISWLLLHFMNFL